MYISFDQLPFPYNFVKQLARSNYWSQFWCKLGWRVWKIFSAPLFLIHFRCISRFNRCHNVSYFLGISWHMFSIFWIRVKGLNCKNIIDTCWRTRQFYNINFNKNNILSCCSWLLSFWSGSIHSACAHGGPKFFNNVLVTWYSPVILFCFVVFVLNAFFVNCLEKRGVKMSPKISANVFLNGKPTKRM